jgi:hypothetical protein
MKIWQCIILACCCLIFAGAAEPASAARDKVATAIFPFEFDDTSLQGAVQGSRPDETARLAMLTHDLHDMLTASGCCMMVDMGAIAQRLRGMTLQACGGCDVDLARQVGASISVVGWVQKVSNLILNINVVARSVSTGKVIDAGSVDIRGNTDESWSRGLSYLVRNRLRPSRW